MIAKLIRQPRFRGFLSRLKVFFSALPPELDESHAETRYRVAQMTQEEWKEYEETNNV
jgi:hypothetical protein